jgi:hypothetical protein
MASGRRGFGGRQDHDPEAIDGTDPIDIAAVRHDDELIDAIAGDGPVSTGSDEEYQLAMLLATWRAELLAPALSTEPDLDIIVAAVNREIGARQVWFAAAESGRRNRLRFVRPIAGAAAAVAVIVGSTTAFSYNAQPGDPLWKVKQVVFSQQANSTIAQMDASNELDNAQRQLDLGDTAKAKASLDHARTRADDVTDETVRRQLEDRRSRILGQLQQQLTPTPATSIPSTRRSTTTSTSTTSTARHATSDAPTTTTAPPLFQIPSFSLPPLPTIPQLGGQPPLGPGAPH